jgi:heme A synthase
MLELFLILHRWLGRLLSAVVLIAVVWTIVLAVRSEEDDRISTVAMKSVVGLVDLQVLLGLILYGLGSFQVSHWHPMLGILAAVSLHMGSKMKGWKRVTGFGLGFASVIGAFLLVV